MHEIAEAIEDRASLRFGHVRQQMPQRQPVVRAGGGQQSGERGGVAAFEAFHAAAQVIGAVLEIRNARTAALAGGAGGAGRDEGFAIAHLKGY